MLPNPHPQLTFNFPQSHKNDNIKGIANISDINSIETRPSTKDTINSNGIPDESTMNLDRDSDRTNNDNASTPTSFMNRKEINQMIDHLLGMETKDLQALYETVRHKLEGRNGYVVDFSPILTGVLGCHTNSLILGSLEQAKVGAHYVGPYVDKNKTPLAESLDVVYEAIEQAKKYPSIAENKGTNARFLQYVLTKILNKLGSLMEISDTQAAAVLLKLCVSICSESFVVCDIEACINMIKNEQKLERMTSFDEDDSLNDTSHDSSSEYHDSADENNLFESDIDTVHSDTASIKESSSTSSEMTNDNRNDFIVADPRNIKTNSGGVLRQILNFLRRV